jgi:hypothetical protein
MHSTCLLALFLLAATSVANVQQPVPAATPPSPAPAPAETPYVLHVYANLVQVPTLVLNTDFKPLPPVAMRDFNIRLDSGPTFHPTKMHIEGDEPISLAVLLDASGNQDRLLKGLPADFAQFAAKSLRPHDRLSVFAIDCKLIRSAESLPASYPQIEQAITNALSAPTLHGGKPKAACGHSIHLWDATTKVIESLSGQPGRRVLLIVSEGEDRKSRMPWSNLTEYAALSNVTVFGLRDLVEFAGDYGYRYFNRGVSGVIVAQGNMQEDLYMNLCEQNGGLILSTVPQDLPRTLETFVAMLRGRYIIEFPRPDDSTAGRHAIDITLRSRLAFIATAGVQVALPEGDRNDPSTVPSAPSPAVMGKRRPVKPSNE